MFEPFLIVVFESLNCPQCEKMDVKQDVCYCAGMWFWTLQLI